MDQWITLFSEVNIFDEVHAVEDISTDCAPRQCSWCNSDRPASSTLRPIRSHHEQCRPCQPITLQEVENLLEICSEFHVIFKSSVLKIPLKFNMSFGSESFHLNPFVKTADHNWIVRVQQESCRATFFKSRAACQQTRNLSWKSFLPFRYSSVRFRKRECAQNYLWWGW